MFYQVKIYSKVHPIAYIPSSTEIDLLSKFLNAQLLASQVRFVL